MKTPSFEIGDLVIDKTTIPFLIGIIDKVNFDKYDEIVYDINSPICKYYCKEKLLLEQIINGKAEVQRRIRS